MVLPMAEMVGWLRQGVGALIRQAGLRVMEHSMEEEVGSRSGNGVSRKRTARPTGGVRNGASAWSWGRRFRSTGRVRTTDDQEVRLGSYEMFYRGDRPVSGDMKMLDHGSLYHNRVDSPPNHPHASDIANRPARFTANTSAGEGVFARGPLRCRLGAFA
jgi:hypothetical protein